jgi:hypothetical protein
MNLGQTVIGFSAIICFAVGGLISAGYTGVFAKRMVFRQLVFDLFLLFGTISIYFVASAPLINQNAKDAGFALGMLDICPSSEHLALMGE